MPENTSESIENHASSNNDCYKLITEELIETGLHNDKGKNAELLSFEIKDFTKKGDGYTTFVTSVTVKYMKDNSQFEVSYVLKLNPQRPPNPIMEDMMKNIFPRESVILTEVMGGMNKHLERISLPNIKIPKLYTSHLERGKEAFVEENLRTQGFQMHSRRNGQDIHHALLVMEELGRFHASSLLLKETIEPKTFVEKFEHFEEPYFDVTSKSFKIFGTMLTSQVEGAIKFLSTLPKYEKCVKWLNNNLQNLSLYFVEGFLSSKPFEVLVHGDCQTNNMLFKYNSMNEVVDMRFVDLQCTRVASPASDINYFAYSSLSGETRSKHLQKLLYTYYQSFSKVLIFARRKVPFTFKELVDEVEKRKMLGLVTGIFLLPFIVLEGDEIVDLGEATEDKMSEFAEKQRNTFHKLSEREGPFKDRFLVLFDEMLEWDNFSEN